MKQTNFLALLPPENAFSRLPCLYDSFDMNVWIRRLQRIAPGRGLGFGGHVLPKVPAAPACSPHILGKYGGKVAVQPCNRSTRLPSWVLGYCTSKIIILCDDRTSKPSQTVTYTKGVRTLLITQEEMQQRLPVRCVRSIWVYLSLSRGWQSKAAYDRDFRVRSWWKRDRGS
jgi:hypothetical protein